MAKRGIILLPANSTSPTYLQIVDEAATVDALWTTASTLVKGYMDFTSVLPGVYAQWAKEVSGLTLNSSGTGFTKWDAVVHSFSAGMGSDVNPAQLPDYLAIDGTAGSAQFATALNQIINVLANKQVGYPNDGTIDAGSGGGAVGVATVAQGGTGRSTLTAHDVVVGAGTSNVALVGPGTAGQVLTSNGASADPSFQSIFVSAPGTASSTGTAGQIAYDSTHIYVCVATDTWVRASLATW